MPQSQLRPPGTLEGRRSREGREHFPITWAMEGMSHFNLNKRQGRRPKGVSLLLWPYYLLHGSNSNFLMFSWIW
jgi:hypothetical protein